MDGWREGGRDEYMCVPVLLLLQALSGRTVCRHPHPMSLSVPVIAARACACVCVCASVRECRSVCVRVCVLNDGEICPQPITLSTCTAAMLLGCLSALLHTAA